MGGDVVGFWNGQADGAGEVDEGVLLVEDVGHGYVVLNCFTGSDGFNHLLGSTVLDSASDARA